ncbi:MAG: alpha-ketoacid dehydrogenase subunit beta [Acidobacteria bacterium]|nr:alpha-ketoacid dehydrogenase subunit beta [Acidobacteriota bacterium]
MTELTMAEALNRTLREEMAADDRVLLLGEEIADLGGIFGVTAGLAEEFGTDRVVDLAISEGGAIGTAAGLAMYGMRPVVEIQFADFIWAGAEQLFNEVARMRYRSGGMYSCPMVVRVPYGVGGGLTQSQSPEAHFAHVPGLIVAAPADATDAAGLMRAAIRSDDPVIFLEPKRSYRQPAPVEDDAVVSLGIARLRREGADLTLVTYGSTVPQAMAAAELSAEKGIQVDVLDLRTLAPFDIGALLGSIAKTGRAVVVSEAPRCGGFASEIGATLAEKAIMHLEAPVERVTGYDAPVAPAHENDYLPDAAAIATAIERVANF